ncbi:MAG: LPP20 family lipoprotein [Pseudomonadales bacterium]
MKKTGLLKLLCLSAVLLLAGCETITKKARDLNTNVGGKKTGETYRATGYALISKQPGATRQEKILNAISASKLNAYRELTAMIHGQYISSSSTVRDTAVINSDLKTAMAGVVRGARVVKSYPLQDDIYATILEVSADQMQRAWVVNNN